MNDVFGVMKSKAIQVLQGQCKADTFQQIHKKCGSRQSVSKESLVGRGASLGVKRQISELALALTPCATAEKTFHPQVLPLRERVGPTDHYCLF